MSADLFQTHPLFSIEYVVHDKSHVMSNDHYHNAYELYFLEEGYHQMLTNDSIYDMTIHDVALFKPNSFHRSYRNQACARTCLYFTERFLHLYFTDRSIKSLLGCFDKDIISLNKDVFPKVKKQLMLLEKENIDDTNNRIFVYLADLLTLLNDHKSSLKTDQTHKDSNFAQILSYINQNYNKITKIEEIAEQFYISKYYLCHRFKETTGLTIIQYINNIKIQHACNLLINRKCNLLINRKLSILEIGIACGFNSSMYFCRVFKQALFMTPSEFRKQAK